MANPGFPLTRL
jgi:hypothetical protein